MTEPTETPGTETPGRRTQLGWLSRRQRVALLSLSAVLALILAAVLFLGRAAPSSSQAAADAAVAPGIDQPTAQVLSLDVLAPGSRRAAPDFHLTDQRGQPVSLSEFRGRSVVLSFNDDQCRDLCTLLAEDIALADQDLGRAAPHVVFLSVNVNPFYPQVRYVKAWTDAHGLGSLPNWYFGTAGPAALVSVWKQYGVYVQQDAASRTVVHGTQMYFIDPSGVQRAIGDFGMNSADTAYFAHAMAQMAVDLLPAPDRLRVGGPATPPPASGNVAPGSPAPDFRLASLRPGQGSVSLGAMAGKPTVINFWTSTCVPCRAELPALEAAYRYFRGQVNFVGIDVSDNPAAASSVAAGAGVTYTLARDPQGTVAGRYRISGTPFTVIVGPRGRIHALHPEPFTTEQIEYVLESDFTNLAPPRS